MATIKAIEARSVHQIQSGQVIVDLNSVIKELVENSLDADATSIEIRFKNNGLDAIEVQDNGSGISPENYDNVALKHYTSKLSSYDDLLQLQTFGFRGEALSSLCALSEFRITTAQANQAPRATRIEFEQSGKLKKTQVVAGQKGTTASVEGLFKKLPVRRRELEKNIKREYGKVLNLLHAYACVSTGVRFSVKNTQSKRNAVVFTTNGNQTTKENIANVYGAKTLLVLIPLDLELEFEPSVGHRRAGEDVNRIRVVGHISRPVFGEGRQTPDRQMFFVNSRPCQLPQIAKAFNEVYKSFNVAQSPFVFADFHMDTNAYDVNVSPDKRTILLHDAGAMIESLKESLQQLFESADQTVPQSQVVGKLPVARQRSIPELSRTTTVASDARSGAENEEEEGGEEDEDGEEREGDRRRSSAQDRMKSILGNIKAGDTQQEPSPRREPSRKSSPVPTPTGTPQASAPVQEPESTADAPPSDDELFVSQEPARPQETQASAEENTQSTQQSEPAQDDFEVPNAVQNAFDRMRPRRVPAEMATITIGNRTVTSMVGSGVPRKRNTSDVTSRPARKRRIHTPSRPGVFGHMQAFAAPGSQMEEASDGDEEEEDIEDDECEEGLIDDEAEEEDVESEDAQDEAEEEIDDVISYASSDDNANQADENNPKPRQTQPPNEDMDEEEKKKHEDAEVQRLIKEAEKETQAHSHRRANKLHKGVSNRDSTSHLTTTIDGSLPRIQSQAESLYNLNTRDIPSSQDPTDDPNTNLTQSQSTAEERLSLTVTKTDFARMRILGQFNLGFILASRSSPSNANNKNSSKDELFIVDQHASDEKINFERLQATTVVQNQRLVRPKVLDLTAVEEEIVIENLPTLEKNGFVIDVDDSGDEPIGKRCSLISLPLSKEVVFDVRDLEELIVLLSESATSTSTNANLNTIPRPSKVRKMFAMRACRSSIMIGKNLTTKQMERVVRDMGSIDKPWNCPHGRPTMRHLFSLGRWEGWDEYSLTDVGDGEDGMDLKTSSSDRLDVWREYVRDMAEAEAEEE
ncbi:ATP-binding mismatch repair protein PMS1 [Aspergillus stella-maris]|uniref:ATP-binding mismatch repair protein PMS1 n=1 Tax=Aspergillus stella-maris TaxID=1810926 RepID=UPI003CCD3236